MSAGKRDELFISLTLLLVETIVATSKLSFTVANGSILVEGMSITVVISFEVLEIGAIVDEQEVLFSFY